MIILRYTGRIRHAVSVSAKGGHIPSISSTLLACSLEIEAKKGYFNVENGGGTTFDNLPRK
jgi:hypothetical protein